MPDLSNMHSAPQRSLPAHFITAVVLLAPSGLLGMGALSGRVGNPVWLWGGAGAALLVALVLFKVVGGRLFQAPVACVP